MTPKRVLGLVATFLAAGLVWLAASPPAGATTMRRMDLPEVVDRADRVLHAIAVENRVYWDKKSRKIYTDTTFEIMEELKGLGSPRVTVTMLGGTLNGFQMSVEGTPTFRAGDEVILFTSPRPGGTKNLVGFSQGVINVFDDPETGGKIARSFVPAGVTYLDRVGGKPTVVTKSPRQFPLPLLLDEIRRLVDTEDSSPIIERRVSPADRALERRAP